MNTIFKNIYPRTVWTNENYPQYPITEPVSNERLGGFLVPFIAGAAVSAPFWLVAGSNKNNQPVYQYPVQYYPTPPTYISGYPTGPYIK